MLAGGVTGAASGLAVHSLLAGDPRVDTFIRYVTTPVGQIFLRLLFMLVIPLLVSALALGVTGLGTSASSAGSA
jgi:DAACS family dicarboxylate/amino acid:cation (Na+ or H+) symporter